MPDGNRGKYGEILAGAKVVRPAEGGSRPGADVARSKREEVVREESGEEISRGRDGEARLRRVPLQNRSRGKEIGAEENDGREERERTWEGEHSVKRSPVAGY